MAQITKNKTPIMEGLLQDSWDIFAYIGVIYIFGALIQIIVSFLEPYANPILERMAAKKKAIADMKDDSFLKGLSYPIFKENINYAYDGAALYGKRRGGVLLSEDMYGVLRDDHTRNLSWSRFPRVKSKHYRRRKHNSYKSTLYRRRDGKLYKCIALPSIRGKGYIDYKELEVGYELRSDEPTIWRPLIIHTNNPSVSLNDIQSYLP